MASSVKKHCLWPVAVEISRVIAGRGGTFFEREALELGFGMVAGGFFWRLTF